ncbi:unnamed protein product, partial [marine sediment metagenome]
MRRAKPFLKELLAAPLVTSGELSEEGTRELRERALEQLTALPGIPEETKKLLTEQLSSPTLTLLGVGLAAGMALGYMTLSSTLSPFFQLLNYQTSKIAKQYRLDPATVSQLWLRGFPKGQDAAEWAGLSPKEKAAETGRQRDEVEKWFGELSDQGFGSDEQEAIKALSQLLPSPQDLVTWQAREVFEPEMIEKYGLLDEVDLLQRDLFYKVGMSDEMIENYWKA